MWSIAVDNPGICQSVTWVHCAKTAKQINILYGVETRVNQETRYWMGQWQRVVVLLDSANRANIT